MFASIPVATLVKDVCFVVHGGIPRRPEVTLNYINQIKRVDFVTLQSDQCIELSNDEDGWECMLDLLWSDPQLELTGWRVAGRGVGIEFGANMVRYFLRMLGVNTLVRSHQLLDEDGFTEEDCGEGFRCVTIFSASNYDSELNKGSILTYSFDSNAKTNGFTVQSYFNKAEANKPEVTMKTRNRQRLLGTVAKHKQSLQAAFASVEDDGHVVTAKVWCKVMQDVTNLDIRWDVLQATMAPADSKDAIDWQLFLSSFEVVEDAELEVELPGHDLGDRKDLSDLYENHLKIKALFAHFDVDGDGRVTREEWNSCCTKFNEGLQKDDPDRFDNADELFGLIDMEHLGCCTMGYFTHS